MEEKRQYIYIAIKNIDEFSVLCIQICVRVEHVRMRINGKTINQRVNVYYVDMRCACFVLYSICTHRHSLATLENLLAANTIESIE